MKVITITGIIDDVNNKITVTTIGMDLEKNELILNDTIKSDQMKVVNAILKDVKK
jgi:hypothetical protein